jgi:hypothetical protein
VVKYLPNKKEGFAKVSKDVELPTRVMFGIGARHRY